MSSAWQIHQTRLASLREQPTPASSWPTGRHAARTGRQTESRTTGGGHPVPVTRVVRLPGIRRPESGPPVDCIR